MGKKDARIKVIHQKNQGLSAARNTGIKEVEGEYIMFVDGDDVIHPLMVDILLNTAIDNKCKVTFCEYERFHDIIEIQKKMEIRIGSCITEMFSPEEFLKKLLCYKVRDVVWNGLYHRDTIFQNEFKVEKRNEDVWWKYIAIDASNKIAAISSCLFYYRKREGSIMVTFSGLKQFDDLEGRYYRAIYISYKYPNLKTLAFSEVIAACMNHYVYSQNCLCGIERKQALCIINKYRRLVNLSFIEIINEKNISRMRQISVILQKVSFRLACYLKVLLVKKIEKE